MKHTTAICTAPARSCAVQAIVQASLLVPMLGVNPTCADRARRCWASSDEIVLALLGLSGASICTAVV